MAEEVLVALISHPLHSTLPTDPDTQGSPFSLSSASVSPSISAQQHGCWLSSDWAALGEAGFQGSWSPVLAGTPVFA